MHEPYRRLDASIEKRERDQEKEKVQEVVERVGEGEREREREQPGFRSGGEIQRQGEIL